MNIDVQHDAQEQRYYAVLEGHESEVAYAEEGDGSRNFHHTFVPPELRGQGVAEKIVRHALDDTRKQGLRYTASCPFVVAFLERHPEYREGSGGQGG